MVALGYDFLWPCSHISLSLAFFFSFIPIICTDPEEFQKMQKMLKSYKKKQVLFPYPSRLNCWIFPFFFFCILKKGIVFVV
ncbi:unnamed protein product [Ixodes hexagonus]